MQVLEHIPVRQKGIITMSQKNVDQRKQEKYNRKKIMAREKRNNFLMKLAGWTIIIAFIGFFGYSCYEKWGPEEKVEAATYALSDKEISSVFEAYTAESEEDTTEGQGDTSEDNTEDSSDAENADTEDTEADTDGNDADTEESADDSNDSEDETTTPAEEN